jgi:hypothetical protein
MARFALVVLAVLVLVLTGTAAAVSADHNQVKLTAQDQAAAKRSVLRLADLGSTWTGGYVKPDLNDALVCANYHPKQSDLVLTGAAESKFSVTGAQLDSTAQVFRTPAMVETDWKRSVLNPRLQSCLKTTLAGNLSATQKVVSLGRVAFPEASGIHAREYRLVIDESSSGAPVRGLLDLIVFSRGRSELSLTTIGSYAELASITRVERVLAGIMLVRTNP